MFSTRPVGPEFLQTAPQRLSFAGTLHAPPKAVFEAIAHDVVSLPHWYGAVVAAEYGGGPGSEPPGVGTKRRVKLVGGVAFHEEVIIWDDPTRYGYRIERTTVPGIRAMAEEWAVVETPTGTRVVWTVAVDAARPMAMAFRSMAPGIGAATRRALGRLDRRLGAG
ncbi:MAG: SRPBCC family protein [Catenulispora sp.]